MDFNTVLVPKCCSLVWICYERYSYWLFSTFVGQVQYRQAEGFVFRTLAEKSRGGRSRENGARGPHFHGIPEALQQRNVSRSGVLPNDDFDGYTMYDLHQ